MRDVSKDSPGEASCITAALLLVVGGNPLWCVVRLYRDVCKSPTVRSEIQQGGGSAGDGNGGGGLNVWGRVAHAMY